MNSDARAFDDPDLPQPDGKATGALVCGIIGLLIPLLAIPALILGFMSLKAANKVSAILGIVFGFIGLLIVPLILAGMLIPAIGLVQQNALMQKSSQNMQVLATGIQQHVAEFGTAPESLAALVERYPDAGFDWRLRSKAAGDRPLPHYLYVRPSTELTGWQPILLENPAHYRNDRLLLVTADGHTERIRRGEAQHIWIVAEDLADISRSEDRPITPADWQAQGVDLTAPRR